MPFLYASMKKRVTDAPDLQAGFAGSRGQVKLATKRPHLSIAIAGRAGSGGYSEIRPLFCSKSINCGFSRSAPEKDRWSSSRYR